MIGILIALALSWLLLYVFEKKSLLALGWLPVRKRTLQFVLGFCFTALLCVLAQLLEGFLKASQWVVHQDSSAAGVLNSVWWDIKSVLTEELIFRGALLYILIKRIGASKAVLISAVAFGIYHWFSYGVLGNVMAMLFVFVGTGLMGYAWALAFSKSKSILLPFGLHLGWNVTYNTVFSKGPLGDLLLVSEGGRAVSEGVSFLNFSIGMIIIPLLVLLFVVYGVKKNAKKQNEGA